MNVGIIARTYSPAVQTKRDKRREKIAQVAARLFQERGYDGVSLLVIADKMKIGRTTLYEYFRSKHEIQAFNIVRDMQIYHRKVADIFETEMRFQDTLEEFIKVQLVYGALHAEFGHQVRSLERHAPRLARRTKEQISGLHGEVYRLMSKAIQGAIDRGEIRNLHPGLVMQLLVNATSFPIRVTDNTSSQARSILDLLWRGIGRA